LDWQGITTVMKRGEYMLMKITS